MSHSRDKSHDEGKKVGVIGMPIKHSKSPVIHNYFIKQLKLNAYYDRYEVKSDAHLDQFVKSVKSDEWVGFNVTIPYKQDVIKYLDEIDDSVAIIGACNTVVVKENRLIGYNTDAEGVYYPLKNKVITNAVVLGNGGASRAVLFQLCAEGIKNICLVARDHSKSNDYVKKINDQYKCDISLKTFEEFNQMSLSDGSLIINTTSIGMSISDEPFNFINKINQSHIFYDLIYNPWKTKMMSIASQNGAQVINGAYMLAHQGALAFNLFFNHDVDTEVMYNLIKEDSHNG